MRRQVSDARAEPVHLFLADLAAVLSGHVAQRRPGQRTKGDREHGGSHAVVVCSRI